jgi:hypothetical protein
MPEFLARKRAHDPDELFQSDWYRDVRDFVRRADRGVGRGDSLVGRTRVSPAVDLSSAVHSPVGPTWP